MSTLQNKIMAAIILTSVLGTTATYAASGNIENIFSSLGTTKTEVKTLVEKQKAGETLTTEQTSLLDQIKNTLGAQGFGKGEKRGEMGMGMGGPMMDDLTDAEKTALESMSEDEKHTFFETKRAQMEAKMEAREAVIDKKLNDEPLTDAEKTILAEIKTQRAEMKAKRAEHKAAFEAIKPVLEKKKAGETLTSEEASQLADFESKFPHPGKGGKHGKGKGGMKGGFEPRD